jgi:hypothetical protein
MQRSDVYYSSYERRADDSYPTIDTRCVDGLLQFSPVAGHIVDPCARDGSAIVDYLREMGKNAEGLDDAFQDFHADWIATNPPFTKAIVTDIVKKQIEHVDNGDVVGLALLVRGNWDFAKTRRELFVRPSYMGQIKLLFRPWWTEDRSQEPKHNYVWHLWMRNGYFYRNIWYYLPPYEERYAVRKHENPAI